jgi:hypothetical protein
MSLTIGARPVLRVNAAAASWSISTAPTVRNPASWNPMDPPPQPQNKSTTVYMVSFLAAADHVGFGSGQ